MFEKLSPKKCMKCQSSEFDQVGMGIYDGKAASGVFFKAKCLSCGTIWAYYDETYQTVEPIDEQWMLCDW